MASNFDRGGYDVEFVNGEPSHSTCCICLFILKRPMQGRECGHRFCKSCATQLPKTDDGKVDCPEDRKKVELFEDLGKERELFDLLVKCQNVRHGCSWADSLRQFDVHVKNCEFEMKKCTNVECPKEIIQKNFQNHVSNECDYRMIRCQSCSHQYRGKFCPECKGSDNLQDTGTFTQQQMTFLVERIRKLEITTQTQAKKLEESEMKNILLNNKFDLMKANFQQSSNTTVLSDTHIWKINQFSRKRQQAQQNYVAPLEKLFYTSRGYKIRTTLYLNGWEDAEGEWLSLGFHATKGAFDDALTWPMKAEIHNCVLVNGNEMYNKCFDTGLSGNASAFHKPVDKELVDERYIPLIYVESIVRKNMLVIKFTVEYKL